ncbi:CYTH domain-containing protein [Cyanobium sp. FGCU-52]|nr:CYTH domain-containing protein [Cyanobium sp. FGCU52]
MALEIERRFLVRSDDWRAHVCGQAELRQGYLLADGQGRTVRVRLSDGDGEARAWLTLKAPQPSGDGEGDGALARLEFEYPIPVDDARDLLRLAPHELAKRRYRLDLPGGEWVLDVFEGANAPLVVVEVELTSVDSPLELPAWCGREISGRHELSNASLARRPLALWSAAEREELFRAGASAGPLPG